MVIFQARTLQMFEKKREKSVRRAGYRHDPGTCLLFIRTAQLHRTQRFSKCDFVG